MSNDRNFVSPELLGQAFKQICKEGRTGILQIITHSNQILTLSIQNGNIASIKCKTKNNKEALQEVGAIQSGRYTFLERANVNEIPLGLPTNDEVLQYLIGSSITVSPPSVQNKANEQQLSDSEKKRLREALAEYIGPIASVLCKNIFAEETDPDAIIDMLADSIPDQSQARNFKMEAKHLIEQ